MLVGLTVQPNARATRSPNSTAWRLTTGSTPGSPKQTGQTAELGLAMAGIDHRAGAEHLRARRQLGMHFQTNHSFIIHGLTCNK